MEARKVVWKAVLPPEPTHTLYLPQGTVLLTAQAQYGALTVWYECDPQAPQAPRRLFVVLTGEAVPEDVPLRYLATVQLDDGMNVLHVYEEIKPDGA